MAELSPDEKHFVEDAKTKLAQYLAERRFSPQIQLAYLARFTFVIIAIGLPMGLLFAAPTYIHPWLAMVRVPVQDLLFYVSSPPTGIVPLALFLLALVAAATFFIARGSDEFAEYAMKEFKLAPRETRERAIRRLGKRLAKLMARGAVSTKTPFDPCRFLIESYRAMARPVFILTSVLGLIAALMLANDFRTYTAFTSGSIKAARWFGFVAEEIPYSHVRAVNVVCHRSDSDRAWLTYDVDVSPSASVHLFGEGTMRSLAPNRMKVDQKLAMAGAPFVYETFDHRSAARTQGISRECANKLEERYRAETRRVIRALIAPAIVEG